MKNVTLLEYKHLPPPPPPIPIGATNTSTSRNTLNISENMFNLNSMPSQDEELVNISEELQHRMEVLRDNITESTSSNHLKGHYCSGTIFNLSHKVLSDAAIKIFGKGLDFAPIQRKINESKVTKDFEEFCRRTRIK